MATLILREKLDEAKLMKYKNANDKELWERCQQGDEGAYAEIFLRHFNRMLRIAAHHVKDTMVAEELVMDCFFNLWTKREQIVDGNFSNYLFRSVRNAIISSYRKEIQPVIGIDQVELTHQADYSTDSYLLMDDIRKVYNKALDKLSPRRREVFVLSRHENLSNVEIAQRMNITESAVKNYMTAALDGLRVNMKECISVLILFLSSIF